MSSSDALADHPDEPSPGTDVHRSVTPTRSLAEPAPDVSAGAPADGSGTIPLSMVRAGATVRVRSTSGKDEMRRRLSEMGFVADAEVTVVSELRGNVIVSVKGVRLAISRAAAHHVLTTDGQGRHGQRRESIR